MCMGFWVGVFLFGINAFTELFTFEYNYANINRSTPAVIFKDYYESTNSQVISRPFVTAKFINVDGSILVITSDKAIFNNNIYNTKFTDNVKIIYLDHVIISDKLDLNFTKNNVVIYDNVVYQGVQGDVIADNILINLITKNIEIFMNDPKNKVTVNTN